MSGTVIPMSAPASREIRSNDVGPPPKVEYQPPPASGTSVSIGWSQGGRPPQQIYYQPIYPTSQPPTPYGHQYSPKKLICCCISDVALIILGIVEIIIAIFCISRSVRNFVLYNLGQIIMCVVTIISSSLLFLGVLKKLIFLCWQFVVWIWIAWLLNIILNIIFPYRSEALDSTEFTIFIVVFVIVVILLIPLRIFETYCVYVFVTENSTDQQQSGQVHPMNPQEKQHYQGYPAKAPPGYTPASFGPSAGYGSPNPNYSNNPQYGGTEMRYEYG